MPEQPPADASLAILITEVRGDVKLVLSKVDDTNRRVGVAEQRLDRHDGVLDGIKAQQWRWIGASSAISALLASGAVTAIFTTISNK